MKVLHEIIRFFLFYILFSVDAVDSQTVTRSFLCIDNFR